MSRPFSEASVMELEALFKKEANNRFVLAQLREELAFRKTKRALQLRKEVESSLDGTVPMKPRPARPDRPEDQIDLLPSLKKK